MKDKKVTRCQVCGERFSGDMAEMFDPRSEPDFPEEIGGQVIFTYRPWFVHAECGLSRGFEVA